MLGEWFAANRILGGVIAAGIVLLLVGLLIFSGRGWGKALCEAAYSTATTKVLKEGKASDENILRNVPITGGRAVKLEWLRRHTVGD